MNNKHAPAGRSLRRVNRFPLFLAASALLCATLPAQVPSTGSGGGRAFDPSSLPGLVCWLKADALHLADGARVASWPDSSPAGINAATQADPDLQPVFATNIVGGLPGVRFDGIRQWLATPAFLDAEFDSNCTIFLVSRKQAFTPDVAMLLVAGTVVFAQGLNRGEGGQAAQFGFSFAHSPNLAASSLFDATQPVVETFVSREHYDYYRVNGAGVPPIYSTNSLASAGQPVRLGGQLLNGRLFGPYDGCICEVLIYRRGLSLAECREVEDHLYDKYSIVKQHILFMGDSLTSGHGAAGTESNYPAQVLTQLGGLYHPWGAENMARGGIPSGVLVANMDTMFRSARRTTNDILVFWIGTGDLRSPDVTGLETNWAILGRAAQASGFRVVFLSLLPAGVSANFEANRQAANTWLRAHYRNFADALADVGADPVIGATSVLTNQTLFLADQLHLTPKGYAHVATNVTHTILNLPPPKLP